MSSRRNRPARLNRFLLTLLGVAAVAAGGFLLAARWGHIPGLTPGASVFPHPHTPAYWVYYAVAAGAVIVGLLCLRWLVAQLALRPRARAWQLERDPSQGRTDLATGVAVAPFTEEITGYPGVRSVRATLGGTHRDPSLTVVIGATADADLSGIRSQLATQGLPRLRQALDLPALPATVEFRAA